MTQVNIPDDYIAKAEDVLKGKPQYNHKRFRNATDITYSVFDHVINDSFFGAKLAEKVAEIDALRERLAQIENAVSDMRRG